jgi:hypothetical protein
LKTKYVKDYILGFHFLVCIGGTEIDAMRKFCSKFGFLFPDDVKEGSHRGMFAENASKPFCGLIWVEKKAGAGTIAHECAHAANHVCRVLELDPRHADEFHSSYLGWLVREVTAVYWRRDGKR